MFAWAMTRTSDGCEACEHTVAPNDAAKTSTPWCGSWRPQRDGVEESSPAGIGVLPPCCDFWALRVFAIALAACSSRAQAPLTRASRQAVRTPSGAQPFATELTAPGPGLLIVDVEQRGISSTVSHASEQSGGIPDRALRPHPPDAATRAGRSVSRRVIDPVTRREIVGEVCVSASLLALRQTHGRARNERTPRAWRSRARDWNAAFAHYAAAARDFDRFAPTPCRQSRATPWANSLIACSTTTAKRSCSSCKRCVTTRPDTEAGLDSSLLSLKAKALLGMEGLDPKVRRERVFSLLDAAEQAARRAMFGAREIPRLDILRGFMEYVADRPEASTAHFEAASQQCEAAKDWECYARARQNLGAMAEETRNYDVALQAFEDALDRLDPDVAPELAADIWGNLGRLQSTAGMIAPAPTRSARRRGSTRRSADCDGARRSLVRLGRLLAQVGSIEDALAYLERSASLDCAGLLERIDRDAAAMRAENEPDEEFAPGRSQQDVGKLCIAPLDARTLSEDGKFAVFLALLSLNDALLLERENEAAESLPRQGADLRHLFSRSPAARECAGRNGTAPR